MGDEQRNTGHDMGVALAYLVSLNIWHRVPAGRSAARPRDAQRRHRRPDALHAAAIAVLGQIHCDPAALFAPSGKFTMIPDRGRECGLTRYGRSSQSQGSL